MKKLPEADRKVLADLQILSIFLKKVAEAIRQDSKGAYHEGKTYARYLGINL